MATAVADDSSSGTSQWYPRKAVLLTVPVIQDPSSPEVPPSQLSPPVVIAVEVIWAVHVAPCPSESPGKETSFREWKNFILFIELHKSYQALLRYICLSKR